MKSRLPAGMRRVVLAAVIAVAGLAWAGKHFVMPQTQAAKTYPRHDDHTDEKVTVALEPYDTAEKASIFSIHFNEIGFAPLLVVISNDSDQAVSMNDMTAQLVTARRDKIPPATDDDIYRRITRPPAGPSGSPLPWPKKKGGVSQDWRDEVQGAQFAARAVEPHSSQSGFMFFDVSGIANPLAGAHLYLSGVRDVKGNEMMYFEVPLDKPEPYSPK
jgi:hypothetical protein